MSEIIVRCATLADIPAMHRVRLAVRENRLAPNTRIKEASYIPYLETLGRGWVLEKDGVVLAFAIGERATGNIWAVFVHQDHEGLGYGKRVQAPMVEWLFAQEGLERIHLSTGAGTRAEGFYAATGWTFTGLDADGDALFEQRRPADLA
ncbi:GNAT family N-acetyltransferase [Paucibacter sp. KBW04]|uniref:GNAT family N-acetyltransferase n=1 Tax=Paucibacter sp. KBW04 TaxID=2153361 RepID=UPI001E653946|nr:GNAT family N-acetyltransferase [Paucibacter sp. KBW04]